MMISQGLLTSQGKPNEKTPKDYAPYPVVVAKQEVKEEEVDEEEE